MDRESAYELLKKKAEKQEAESQVTMKNVKASQKSLPAQRRSSRESPMEAMLKSAARSIGSPVGRQIIRGILGSLFGKR